MESIKSLGRLLPVLFVLGVLPAGCGYQLAGGVGPLVLDAVRVESPPGFWETGLAFREALAAAGVEVARESDIRVSILDERARRTPVATTASIEAAEYQLRLEVVISISLGEEVLLADTSLTAERTYSVDAANLAGSQQEQALLQQEMREALAKQMVLRLKAVADGRVAG